MSIKNIIANWKDMKSSVQNEWGNITDSQLEQIAGDRNKLSGYIEESYGLTKEDATKQIANWEETYRKLHVA